MKKCTFFLFSFCFCCTVYAQTLYVSNGTSGIAATTSASGNVGVGVVNPSQKLEVQGNVRIDGPSSTSHSELTFYRGDGAKFASIGQGILTSANSTFDIQHFNGNDIRFLNSGTELLRIVSSNGNVGIGTTSPTARLNVLSTVSATNGIVDIGASGSNASLKIGLNVDYAWMQSYGSRPLRINEIGNDVLFNINGGNVGIGTHLTDAKLTVLGSVHANEVKVDLNVPGPDYVFESTYELPTLEELAAYVNLNKHLPEVPSASAMNENGINLGEMNMLLLKKVEELTLYLLQQQQVIKKQNDRITQLETNSRK